MTFYKWLQSQPNEYAFLLSAYERLRIPKNANRLNVLLRHANRHWHKPIREALKTAHREWREFLKKPQFVEIAELQDIETPHLSRDSKDLDWIPAGLVRGEPMEFTVNFKLNEEEHKRIQLAILEAMPIWLVAEIEGLPPVKSERWGRVYRRWSFKHRRRCAVCQRTNFFGTYENAVCSRDECIDARKSEVGR